MRIIVLCLLVLLVACQQSIPYESDLLESSLLDDSRLDWAIDASSESVDLDLLDHLSIPSSINQLDKSVATDLTDLSTQAVLADAKGYVYYVLNNPAVTRRPWQIIRHNQQDNSKTVIYAGKRSIQSIGGSVDGDAIAFIAKENLKPESDFEVYLYIISTDLLLRLTRNRIDEADVSLSSDALVVAWQGFGSSHQKAIYIRTYASDYGSFSQKRLQNRYDQHQPSLTGDGLGVVYVRTSNLDRLIYTLISNGQSSILHLSSPYTIISPSASDQAKKVLWGELIPSRSANPAHELHLLDLMTATATLLLNDFNGIEHPHITRDGLWATYGLMRSGRWEVFTRDLIHNSQAKLSSSRGNSNNFGMNWQNAHEVLYATLEGSQEVPPVTTPATGYVIASLYDNALNLWGSYWDLKQAASAAHIHGSRVSFDLNIVAGVPNTQGTLNLQAELTEAQKSALLNGLLYVNIHTPVHPSGEVRGYLK